MDFINLPEQQSVTDQIAEHYKEILRLLGEDVEREGLKPIVLGKNGQMIKKIGASARQELTKLFEKEVHLFLFVKVKENWRQDPSQYKEWGLDFNA